jgi:hypothetical protein
MFIEDNKKPSNKIEWDKLQPADVLKVEVTPGTDPIYIYITDKPKSSSVESIILSTMLPFTLSKPLFHSWKIKKVKAKIVIESEE